MFKKGWNHLTPKPPQNLQERWHRAAIERVFHPEIIQNVKVVEKGKQTKLFINISLFFFAIFFFFEMRNSVIFVFYENKTIKIKKGKLDTMEWRQFFETTAIKEGTAASANMSESEFEEFRRLSPWHDIPFGFESTHDGELYFNYINEIPLGTRAKMEIATKEAWNPIKQDIKKGNLRYFKYGDIPFNYGCIPQTWEDPSIQSFHSEPGLGLFVCLFLLLFV